MRASELWPRLLEAALAAVVGASTTAVVITVWLMGQFGDLRERMVRIEASTPNVAEVGALRERIATLEARRRGLAGDHP